MLKCNPDSPQLGVRALALQQGKLVYVAVPRFAQPNPFFLLGPASLKAKGANLRLNHPSQNSLPSCTRERSTTSAFGIELWVLHPPPPP